MRAAAAALAVAALAVAAPAQAARIAGTARGDLLHGTARADTVLARAGNDRIDVAGGGRDTVSCGPGRDLATADLSDRIGADCEVVLRRISVDLLQGGGAAQHSTEVEPSAFAWGSTVVADFQVGRFADGGSLAIGFAVSRDAGRTWRNGILPGITVASRPAGRWLRVSDPVVTYDAAHGMWVASTFGLGMTDSAMLVSRSADGLHWSAPAIATQHDNAQGGTVFDKDWIACDNVAASPFRGHCYLSYSDFVAGRLSTQTSVDGGATWSAPAGSPDLAGADGMRAEAPAPQPAVTAAGTLVIPIFEGDRMDAVQSPDGGATFTPETPIAPVDEREAPFRAAPLPSGAADGSGNLSLAWSDGNSMFATHSTDGVAWTPPAAVPLGPGRPFVPGLGTSWTSPGRLALTAYVWTAAGTLKAVLVRSTDGGATWSAPQLLSPDAMPLGWLAHTTLGPMVGDYIATVVAGSRAVPVVVLAQKPLGGRLREAVYAASIPLG